AREIEGLLGLVLRAGDRSGSLDLEAVEMAVRSSMHQAGAAVLDQLLEFDPPSAEQRQLPCTCGDTARYVGIRSKPVLDGGGKGRVSTPLLLVRELPSWSVSDGCATGCREHGTLARRAPHVGCGRPGRSFRSGPATDGAAGGAVDYHQSGGTYRRGHRRR